MAHAVQGLKVKPDALLVDAMNVPLNIPQVKLIHGDAKSNSIAAASIVAKVFRDNLMDAYGEVYPEYDFKHNAGYGTREHMEALKNTVQLQFIGDLLLQLVNTKNNYKK